MNFKTIKQSLSSHFNIYWLDILTNILLFKSILSKKEGSSDIQNAIMINITLWIFVDSFELELLTEYHISEFYVVYCFHVLAICFTLK